MTPIASVLIPLHNRERFVTAAIKSVLNQTRDDFELIVWDDGSTDRSVEVAQAAAGGDGRVRLLHSENRGVCAALNAAAALARGRYLGWVDSDDALAPEALAETVATLEARPELGMVYTQQWIIDEQGELQGLGKSSTLAYSKERLLVDYMTHHFRLMRRELFERLGGLDESMAFAEDYDLCLRLSEVAEIAQVEKPLYYYRVHRGAISTTHRVEQILKSKEAIERALVRRGLSETYEVGLELQSVFELRPKQVTVATSNELDAAPDLAWGLLSEAGASEPADEGLVSCLCVTNGNYRHLSRAVRCFTAQTYRARELILVCETLDQEARRLVEHTPGVVLVPAPTSPKQPLGALRNLSLGAARGAFVCLWDDDDWHSPRRIEIQLEALLRSQSDACLLSRWLLFDEREGRGYVSGKRLWEGSLLCRKNALDEGFPAPPRDEDRPLVERLQRQHRLASVDRPELYVHTHHGRNTRHRQNFRAIFERATPLGAPESARLAGVLVGARS